VSLLTSRRELGPIVLRVSTDDGTGNGTNVLSDAAHPAPHLTPLCSVSLSHKNTIRNFSFLENKLYVRTDSTVFFVMKDFLAQSLVHGAINCTVIISMAHMVLLHLQLDLHVLFVSRYSQILTHSDSFSWFDAGNAV
jgi:hypothetical protein